MSYNLRVAFDELWRLLLWTASLRNVVECGCEECSTL